MNTHTVQPFNICVIEKATQISCHLTSPHPSRNVGCVGSWPQTFVHNASIESRAVRTMNARAPQAK